MKLGDRVLKNMGVRQVGTVVESVPRHLWSDGSYRYPESGESPVWVRWDDGTMGWIHECFLEKLGFS